MQFYEGRVSTASERIQNVPSNEESKVVCFKLCISSVSSREYNNYYSKHHVWDASLLLAQLVVGFPQYAHT